MFKVWDMFLAMLLFIQVPEKIDDPLNMICMELLIHSPLLPGSESVLGKATLHIHNIMHVSTLASTQPSNKCEDTLWRYTLAYKHMFNGMWHKLKNCLQFIARAGGSYLVVTQWSELVLATQTRGSGFDSWWLLVSSPDLIWCIYNTQETFFPMWYWKWSTLGLVLGLGPRLSDC